LTNEDYADSKELVLNIHSNDYSMLMVYRRMVHSLNGQITITQLMYFAYRRVTSSWPSAVSTYCLVVMWR